LLTQRLPGRISNAAANTTTMANELPNAVLSALAEQCPILSSDAFPGVPSTTIKSALDRLASREMVAYETIVREEVALTEEGKGIAAEGSHEAKVFEAVRKAVEGLKITELPVSCNLLPTPQWNNGGAWIWSAANTDDLRLSLVNKQLLWVKARRLGKDGSRKTATES